MFGTFTIEFLLSIRISSCCVELSRVLAFNWLLHHFIMFVRRPGSLSLHEHSLELGYCYCPWHIHWRITCHSSGPSTHQQQNWCAWQWGAALGHRQDILSIGSGCQGFHQGRLTDSPNVTISGQPNSKSFLPLWLLWQQLEIHAMPMPKNLCLGQQWLYYLRPVLAQKSPTLSWALGVPWDNGVTWYWCLDRFLSQQFDYTLSQCLDILQIGGINCYLGCQIVWKSFR